MKAWNKIIKCDIIRIEIRFEILQFTFIQSLFVEVISNNEAYRDCMYCM